MLIGSILGWELGHDDLFDFRSPRNRDDCLEPMRVLQKSAFSMGINLHTDDVILARGISPDFTIYIESIPYQKGRAPKNYLIRFETHLTVPLHQDINYLNNFDGIFTWDLDLLEGAGFNKDFNAVKKTKLTEIRTPNPKPSKSNDSVPTYVERSIFCSLIASNRHANMHDARELYSERAKVIRWFEKNASANFKLFGNGWNVPQKRFGFLGKTKYRFKKIIPYMMGRPVFSSYQGPIEAKDEVLINSKFCICFENAKDIRGYLTEKIFDCFFSGCVPIYWGEPNIDNWVPKECFIDFRDFDSLEKLYDFMIGISAEKYKEYQMAANNFINSEAFVIHSSQSFASQILERISNDFQLKK